MLYATIFHFLAGGITGSLFKTRTLLLLLAFVAVESVIIAFIEPRIAVVWAIAAIVSVQFGYVAGIFVRGLLERAGYSSARIKKRRIQVWFADVIKGIRLGQKNSRE